MSPHDDQIRRKLNMDLGNVEDGPGPISDENAPFVRAKMTVD